MVSSKLFYQIRKRLNEIFSSGQDVSFGRKSFWGCGDLCQLPPVRPKPVFTFNDTETMEEFIIMEIWHQFRLAELDQVMRQDDEIFANMLNNISVGEIDLNIEDIIKLRFIDKNNSCDQGNNLHIFAENTPVKRHNGSQLKHISGQLIPIPAKVEVPKNSKMSDIREAQD